MNKTEKVKKWNSNLKKEELNVNTDFNIFELRSEPPRKKRRNLKIPEFLNIHNIQDFWFDISVGAAS